MRRRRIRFEVCRLETGEQAVEVLIGNQKLRVMWESATGEAALPLALAIVAWPGHRLWLGEPPLSEEHGRGDRRSVLSCIDGLLDCGGATARIIIGDQTVVWEDFRDVPSGDPVDLGPFVFDRRHYERALAKVVGQAR